MVVRSTKWITLSWHNMGCASIAWGAACERGQQVTTCRCAEGLQVKGLGCRRRTPASAGRNKDAQGRS